MEKSQEKVSVIGSVVCIMTVIGLMEKEMAMANANMVVKTTQIHTTRVIGSLIWDTVRVN